MLATAGLATAGASLGALALVKAQAHTAPEFPREIAHGFTVAPN